MNLLTNIIKNRLSDETFVLVLKLKNCVTDHRQCEHGRAENKNAKLIIQHANTGGARLPDKIKFFSVTEADDCANMYVCRLLFVATRTTFIFTFNMCFVEQIF